MLGALALCLLLAIALGTLALAVLFATARERDRFRVERDYLSATAKELSGKYNALLEKIGALKRILEDEL